MILTGHLELRVRSSAAIMAMPMTFRTILGNWRLLRLLHSLLWNRVRLLWICVDHVDLAQLPMFCIAF